MPSKYIVRECLKCDKNFRSLNGLRLCNECHCINKNMNGNLIDRASIPSDSPLKKIEKGDDVAV